MTTAAPLLITPAIREGFGKLRDLAAENPIDMHAVLADLKTGAGQRRHSARMKRLTIAFPSGRWVWTVTFSIEHGHPVGPCRHLSVSIHRKGRVPHPEAMRLIAEDFGFVGGLEACQVWPEDSGDRETAINLVQPLALAAAGSA